MKTQFKFTALAALTALSFSASQASAQENLAFEGFKLSVGAGMGSTGGTAKTAGSGNYDHGAGEDSTDAAFTGDYAISGNSNFKPESFTGRVEVGFDWAIDERGIIGLSLSKDFGSKNALANLPTSMDLDTDGTCSVTPCDSSVTFRDSSPNIIVQNPYALALRAGYVMSKDTMLYTKISYAQTKVGGDISKTAHGIGLGLGFEANLSTHWFVRGELETIRYREFDVTTSLTGVGDFTSGSVTDKIKLSNNAARVLIGVRF